MNQQTGYCMRCRMSVPIHNPRDTVTSKGQCMLSGECYTCGTKVNRFISAEQRNVFNASEAACCGGKKQTREKV